MSDCHGCKERDERIKELALEVSWLCESCDTVFPGPPSDGVDCDICPVCFGSCAPQTYILRMKAEKERDALRERVKVEERNKKEFERDWLNACDEACSLRAEVGLLRGRLESEKGSC